MHGCQTEPTDGPKGRWGSEFLSLSFSVYLSICLYIYLSICLTIYLSIFLSIWLPLYLSVCLPIHLSIHPSIFLSIYPSIYPSINLSIYLIYLQAWKRSYSAWLLQSLNLATSKTQQFCANSTTAKTKQFCETSFKNSKSSAELTASYQCVLRFFIPSD